jgi:hypothetical protein
LPLETIYLLEDASEGDDDTIISISGADAFERLSAMYYRAEMGRFLDQPPRCFRWHRN